MTVPFNRLPSNQRAPFFYAEFDNSMANTATAVQRTLLIGQMLSTATATPGIPQKVSSDSAVAGICGSGSMLHNMMTAYLANDISAELWILPLADGTTGTTAATGKLQVVTAAAATGVLSLYIAGVRVQLTVVSTDDNVAVAAAIAAVINAQSKLPVIAEVDSATTDTVKLTAKNKGAHGNSIDIRLNYQGAAGGEETPQGMELKITVMAGGAGAPALTDALGNLQDRAFDFIVNPYTDTTSLDAVKEFLSDATGRWSYAQQLYGHSFGALAGTYGSLSAAGEARNNQHETLLGINGSPTPAYLWAAALTGAIAPSLRNDPGRPTQTLTISGVLAPQLEDRFTLTERNNLLYSGISNFTVADDGSVQVEKTITTYQKNKFGDADDSYLNIETLFLLMFVTRFLRTQITSKFSRMKLANDGTRFAPGSAIVTPNVIRAELIAQYRTLEYNGYVQDAAAFAKTLLVERNSSNSKRIDVLWTGTLIDQLEIFALLNQWRRAQTAA
ncbi:phage tail sheath subtilisin-like domain-containing protein [Serratia liquefaciens]|uniref:phage tail sheath subtilisin-like domain-containing protein n=1 Tax=Serratia liquefaciens TaxID=614 RepID=UPI001F312836|nr:phage tail sheath subtilisin-like domain-containing protein [Serratia liquefaciens]MCE9937712.1 phage tail sheath subtilisin-like domain-containing protein [Serratia liquefaciens]